MQTPIEGSTRAQQYERMARERFMARVSQERNASTLEPAMAEHAVGAAVGLVLGHALVSVTASKRFRWVSRVLVLVALVIMAQPILWAVIPAAWFAWRSFRVYLLWEGAREARAQARLERKQAKRDARHSRRRLTLSITLG